MANQISVNTGSGSGAQQVIVDSNGNITVTVSRSVIGTVANVASANYANFAGEVVDPSQPNITSVGTLSNLSVANTITTNNLVVTGNLSAGNLIANTANFANFAGEAFDVALANVSGAGNIASINIDGSTSNVLYGNGIFAPAATGNVANANFANFAGTAFSVDGGNVSGAVANATFALDAGNANIANIAYSVDGANVSGAVANATFALDAGNANIANIAYSVDAANVSGLGNIATVNLDGNVSNLLTGNGTFVAIPTSTANANYANFAGNAFSVDGANVVGAVANANYAANAAFADNATFANYVGYAVDNTSASAHLVSFVAPGLTANKEVLINGNFIFYPLSETLQVNNVDSTIIKAAQPNITSVGTLTALTANTTTPINVSATNSNLTLFANNNSNISGTRLSFVYNNPVSNTNSLFGAQESGFDLYMANIAPGNVGTGNIRSYWQFLTNGDFRHTVGGSGNIIAKNLILGNVFTGQFNGNIVAGNGNIGIGNVTLAAAGKFTGNAAGLTNIPGANITGLGNIINVNLDGNASNFLDGTGNFVAASSGANANYANFAGDVVNSAQPNITSVGTLTGLITAATSNVTIEALNNNAVLKVTANANGFGAQQNYTGTHIEQQTQAGASESGFTITTANTNPGNTFPSNLKGVWRFDSTGNLAHLIGGTGAIVAKQGVFGTGNVSAGNISGTVNVSAGNVVTSNVVASGTLNLSTNSVTNGVQVSGRQITLNGIGEQPPSNGVYSLLNLVNGSVSVTQDNIGGGLGSFQFNQWENTNSFVNPYAFFRARGNAAAPSAVANGDSIISQQYYCYADSGNTYSSLGSFAVNVSTNDGAGNVSSIISISTANNDDGSGISLITDNINLSGNVSTPYNINVNSGNVIIGANGSIDYNRVFGCFHKVANVTAANANTIYNFDWYNDTTVHVGNEGVTVTSGQPTRVNIDTAGSYEVFLEMHGVNVDNQDRPAYVWLAKNGTDISETCIKFVLQKETDTMLVKEWLVDNLAANDYLEVRFAVDSVSGISLEYIAGQSSPYLRPAVPSATITVTPVGA